MLAIMHKEDDVGQGDSFDDEDPLDGKYSAANDYD